MSKIHFEVEDDVVIKYTSMPEIGENTYKTDVVMTKEIFQECFKKWVTQETETWEDIHAQITAPNEIFDKIWEEAESEVSNADSN